MRILGFYLSVTGVVFDADAFHRDAAKKGLIGRLERRHGHAPADASGQEPGRADSRWLSPPEELASNSEPFYGGRSLPPLTAQEELAEARPLIGRFVDSMVGWLPPLSDYARTSSIELHLIVVGPITDLDAEFSHSFLPHGDIKVVPQTDDSLLWASRLQQDG